MSGIEETAPSVESGVLPDGSVITLTQPADYHQEQRVIANTHQIMGRHGGGRLDGSWEHEGRVIAGGWTVLGLVIGYYILTTLSWSWEGMLIAGGVVGYGVLATKYGKKLWGG